MEVMRPHVNFTKRQYMHGRRSYIDNAVLILERAIDAEKLSTRHRYTVPLIQLRVDDGVRDACFIFEAKEDEAFGCARTLSGNHCSCDAGKARSAYARAWKACEHEKADAPYSATTEWQKIFGDTFKGSSAFLEALLRA